MRDATSQDMTESPLWIKMENDAFYGRIAALKFKGIEVALPPHPQVRKVYLP